MTAAVSALAVAVATVVTAVGGGTAGATGSGGTTGITLTDPASAEPRTERPLVVGESGYLHRQSGVAGLLWTDVTTGATVTVSTGDGVYAPASPCADITSTCRTAWYGSDGDLVALPTALSSKSVTLWDPATRTTSTVTSSYSYRALAGGTVVTGGSLIDFPGGERRERVLTGDGTTTLADNTVAAADSRGVLVKGSTSLSYVDLATAVSTPVFSDLPHGVHAVLGEDRFGWYDPDTGDLHLKSRTDPAGAEQVYDLPVPGTLHGAPVLVGDRLLLPLDAASLSWTGLTAVSLADGTSQTLLTASGAYALQAPGDEALVSGGTGADDWWLQRVQAGEDGSAALTKVARVPALENVKTGIALSRGSLRVVESGGTTSVRALTTDGGAALESSAATDSAKIGAACPYTGVSCAPLWGNSGHEPNDVYLTTYTDETDRKLDRIKVVGYSNPIEFDTSAGRIVDVSDDYVVYQSGGTSPTQYVWEIGQGQKLKRTGRAAALNGSTLWSAGATAGQVTSYGLTEDKTLTTVTVPGAGCVPTELQAAGRWLYWACGTASAGVYDTQAGTSVAVTPGDVLLGDGFTVRHDHATDELVLTEAATGTARTLASGVPDTGQDSDRRWRWTVDEYTGLVAWFDGYERTQVATTGITPSAPTLVSKEIDGFAAMGSTGYWSATWRLSRPITSWSLTFTSVQSGPTGRATRTITGGAATAYAYADWNGLTSGGARFPNGVTRWTLRTTGLGGSSLTTTGSGSQFINEGSAVRHDHGGMDGTDGIGDLLTLNTSGTLTVHQGTGGGKFSGKLNGSGWPQTITAVPVGDLSGDRCNDVLVRLSSGALRLYKPGCNSAVKPATKYTTLATGGWNQYDVLTSPGDVTGDGRPDLVARVSSTGTVYLYKGTSAGKLSSRVKLYDNLKTYKRIAGAGDLDGDGIGDLIVQDKANNLYRYSGTGKGTFSARVKLFANWGTAYNAVVGVGDLNGDGRPDLVARDTAGKLYRQYGDGKGSFGARVLIGSGWGGYRALS